MWLSKEPSLHSFRLCVRYRQERSYFLLTQMVAFFILIRPWKEYRPWTLWMVYDRIWNEISELSKVCGLFKVYVSMQIKMEAKLFTSRLLRQKICHGQREVIFWNYLSHVLVLTKKVAASIGNSISLAFHNMVGSPYWSGVFNWSAFLQWDTEMSVYVSKEKNLDR